MKHVAGAYQLIGLAVLLTSVPCSMAQIPVATRDLDADAGVYTIGTIRPDEGTIEVTSRPTRPGSEFQNSWYFAFRITPGQPMVGNSLLGLFTPSGEDGPRGLSGVARVESDKGRRTYYSRSNRLDFFAPGVDVNLALSWGPKGLLLYVNGEPVGQEAFSGTLAPMPALFDFVVDSGMHVRAAKISTRQLPPDELARDPAMPFEKSGFCSFLWHLGQPAAYLPTAFSQGRSDLLPVWRLDEAMTPLGSPAELLLAGANGTSNSAPYRVRATARNFEGQVTGSSENAIRLPAQQPLATWRLPLPGVARPGFYAVEIAIESPDRSVTVWTRNHMVFPPNDPAVADGKLAEFMGHHLLERPENLARLGIRWLRAWGDARCFLWHAVEPQPGAFDWLGSDRAVAAAQSNGVHLLGLLGNPPAWAAVEPDAAHKAQHPLAHLSGRWKPRSLKEWESYVFQTVSRYKGSVKHWEIYNEVDFHPPAMAASFSGSTEEYFQLLQSAWKAAKAADPDCKILISGFSLGAVTDLKMPYDLLNMGAATYCDIFNMHAYQGLVGVDRLQQAVAAAAPGMPIWQTEQMWHTISDVRKRCELTAAIHFWFLDKGFAKYFNFGDDFFANRFTRSPEAVLQTLATLQSHLRKCETSIGTLPDLSVRDFNLKHALRRTDGRYFTAIGQLGEEVRLHLAGRGIRAEDIFGRELAVTRVGDITMLPVGSIALVVSDEPLRVARVERVPRKLCLNPGFEEVSGDIAMGGLQNALIHNWELRPNSGAIGLDPDAHSGNYALKIGGAAKERVQAFFETIKLPAGRYAFSAWLKSATDKPASACFAFHDRAAKRFESKRVSGIAPKAYTRCTVEFDFPAATDGSTIFSVGTDANSAGTAILFDDVELVRLPLFRPDATQAVPVVSPAGRRSVSAPGKTVDWGPMLASFGVQASIQGMDVAISAAPVFVAYGGDWHGTDGRTFRIPVIGQFSRLAVLVGAVYVPEGAQVLGVLRIVYQDGTTAEMPLENHLNLRDWYLPAKPDGIAPDIFFVDAAFKEFGLFLPVWKNPMPDKAITAIELEAATDGPIGLAGLMMERN